MHYQAHSALPASRLAAPICNTAKHVKVIELLNEAGEKRRQTGDGVETIVPVGVSLPVLRSLSDSCHVMNARHEVGLLRAPEQ